MEIIWLLYFIISSIAAFLLISFVNGRFLSRYYKVPFIGITFPFIFGNMSRDKNLPLKIADFYEEYRNNPIIGIRLLFIKPALIITDLVLAKLVLVTNFEYFQNRGLFYNEKDDPLSAILGTVDHDQWKPMRRKLTPAFTSMKIKEMFPQLKNLCDLLAENLNEIVSDGEQAIEILSTFSRFTTDAIGKVAFGNASDESADLLREMVGKSKQPYLKFPYNLITLAFPKFARTIGMRKHPKEVTDFFVNYVSQIVKYREENNVRPKDFMQSMIDAELGIPRIAAIAFDLLSAGYADSTSTLAYCLYELAVNTNIQQRARDEIQSILEEYDEFSYDALQKMLYIKQIIQEAERKYPVAGIATRIATKDFKVPDTDVTIPCGMKVFIPIYAIHHDAKYYPNPQVFDPDRFTEDAKKERPKLAFVPFGDGCRQCIGYRFAEMLIGIGLVSLLKNFEFSTCEETEIPIKFNEHKHTLHPKSGVTLKVRRIQAF